MDYLFILGPRTSGTVLFCFVFIYFFSAGQWHWFR